MTRKDYIFVAEHLSAIRMDIPTNSFVICMQTFADIFEKDNPQFDRDRFIKACYV